MINFTNEVVNVFPYEHDLVDPVATKMCPDGQYWSGLYQTGCLDDPNYTTKIAAPIEMHPIDLIAPTPIAVSSVVTMSPKVETILGNGLTNSQKWAWVIGLTFAAWALLYWSQKKSN